MFPSIYFNLNGKRVKYDGNPSSRLLHTLRNEFKLTGTKCGCLEGECGACSVIIDGKLHNSCLVAMGTLQDRDVVTIEGYSKTERFSALEKAYTSVSAVQCGFCIPGMMLASECLLAANLSPTNAEIREAISGNLCRCTGYDSIVKAIEIASKNIQNQNMSTDNPSDTLILPPPKPDESRFFSSESSRASLKDALSSLKDNPNLVPYTGGTDLMVESDCAQKQYLFLGHLDELKQIAEDDKYIRFGAACSFTQVIESKLTPGILRDMCRQIAAPSIRNAGSLGGNIANGSAKADSALVFTVTDSMLRLVRISGEQIIERVIPIRDFYLGGSKTALADGELIAEILMPKHGIDNYCLEKVGARNALAISRVSFAGIMNIKDNVILNCAAAFGAVADTIIRFPDIEKMLIGKTIEEAKASRGSYLSAYVSAIVPRRGRVGIAYRKDVCMNLLDFFLSKNNI